MNMINHHHQQLNNNNNNNINYNNNNNNNLRTIGDVEGNIVSDNNNDNNDDDGDISNEDSMLASTVNMSPTHVYSAYHEDSNVGTSRDFFIGK